MVSSSACREFGIDTSLRPFLDAYDKKYADAKKTVNDLKLQVVPPTFPRAVNGKRGGKGKGTGDDVGVGDDEDSDGDKQRRGRQRR